MTNKVALEIGRDVWTHKPSKPEMAIAQQPKRYACVQVSAKQAYELITGGRCWRAGLRKNKNGGFTNVNTTGSNVFALDFDECEVAAEDMAAYAESKGLKPNFLYWSFSQGKKTGNNYRLVWILDRTLTPTEYVELYKAVQTQDEMFSKSDKQTSNISRLWVGTDKGGVFFSNELTPVGAFDIFPRTAEKQKRKVAKYNSSSTDSDSEEQFIVPGLGFPWDEYLRGVCELWDMWRNGKYLRNTQRFLLFSSLKQIRYPAEYKTSMLQKVIIPEVLKYYEKHKEIYADSGCNKAQIEDMFFRGNIVITDESENDKKQIVETPDGKQYTVAEYFNSGAYKEHPINEREALITLDELETEMAGNIPQILNDDGMDYTEVQVGAGKTQLIIEWIKGRDLSKEKIVYAVPRYNLLTEFLERATEAGIDQDYIVYPRKADYTEEDLLYLAAGFPQGVKTTEQMRERKRELDKLRDEDHKGLFLITHACLANLKSFKVDTIIIDENIEDVLISKRQIDVEALYALGAFVGDEGKAELQKLIQRVEDGKPREHIEGVNVEAIFNAMDVYRVVHSKSAEVLAGIGFLHFAPYLAVGCGEYPAKRRYLYLEVISNMLNVALAQNTRVKFFTGTSKIGQLKAGIPAEQFNQIRFHVLQRAALAGNIYQYFRYTGSKKNIAAALKYALDTLGKDVCGSTNTLTLKAAVEQARAMGFKIPQTAAGEDLYIENCSGIDSLKGQNLIIIGKADLPTEALADILHDSELDTTRKTKPRRVEGITGVVRYSGYNDDDLERIHQEHMRQMIEQASGRSRALRTPTDVFIFSDYPVRGAIRMD